ncbi:autotransporter outer membrane beta-barrel domain-containing protein [Termitidicoccus mucosus]
MNLLPLHAATYTWTGSAGDNDWYNAANWDAGIVPLQTDIVSFNTIAGPVFDSVSATAATLNIGNTANTTGSIALNNSYLRIAAANIGANATGTAFMALNNSTLYVTNNLNFATTGYAVVDLHGSSTITVVGTYDTGVGNQTSGTGIITLNDSSAWLSPRNMQLGSRGYGVLILNGNSRASAPTTIYIGGNLAAGARGLVEIHGSAHLSSSGSAVVGHTGTGTVILTDSGSFTASSFITLGQAATHKGIITLSDNALISSGSLIVGLGGTGTVTFLNGGNLRANAITLASSGAARGTLEIAGNGSHSITRGDGQTLIDIVGGTGTGGATVLFTHVNSELVFNNKLTGALAVEVNGSGCTTLAAENDYTGGNIVRSGTLAGTPANIRGAILVDGGGVELTTPNAYTLTLTGTGSFNKLGAGTLTLASNFGGAFDISAGAVAFDTAATLDSARAVTLASGGTLSGSLARTAGQTLSAAAGSAITGNVSFNNTTLALSPASPGAAAFSIGGNLTFADSTLKLGLFDAADTIITIAGSLSISGVNTLDLTPGMSGTYTIAGFGALAGSTITIDGAAQGGSGARQNATSVAAGSALQILVQSDISRRLTWTGSDSASWDTTGDNWTGSNNTKNYISLDAVTFDGVSDAGNPANRAITLTGNTRVSDITVSGDADYTFAGAGGITSGTRIITLPGNPDNLAGVTGKLIKTGAGTLTFENTGANNFGGGIEISGGAIVFDNVAQLGTAITESEHAAIAFTGTGGTLAGTFAGDGMLAGAVSIAGSATATFEIDGAALMLSSGISGAGTLEKTGDGTLEISGSAAHAGAVTITGGTLAAGANNLRGASIINNAALALRAETDADYSGAITGTGAFFKTGAGTLEFTGTLTLQTVTISQGSLVIKPVTMLAAASVFDIATGAALMGTGSFSAPQLTNAGVIKVGRAADPSAPHGVMTFAGNYTGAATGEIRLDMSLGTGGTMEFDRFIINGDADGFTRVSLQEQPSADPLRGDTSLLPSLGDMLIVTGSAAEGAFVQNGTVEFAGGKYQWDPALNAGTGGWRTLVAEPIRAIAALDAAALIIGKAAFASLENRLPAARETTVNRSKQFWLAGFQRDEKFDGVRYDRYDTPPRADADTQGVQAGFDWLSLPTPESIFIFGLFLDHAKSDIHLPGRVTTGATTSTGGGLYASGIIGAWHIDALLRNGTEKYDAVAPRVLPFSTSGYSWGGQLSAGRDIALGKAKKWRLEPAARIFYQAHKLKSVTDSAGRRYSVVGADMKEFRASLRISHDGTWKNNLKCAPWLRVGWLCDIGGDGRVNVADQTFKNALGGTGAEIGAGLLLNLSRKAALQADLEWFDTAATQGAAATLGIAFAW